jgi:hypothetical protein
VRAKLRIGVTQRSISSTAGAGARALRGTALVRKLHQCLRAAGDEVARRLVAGDEQRHAEHEELFVREPVAVDLRRGKRREEVVLRPPAPLAELAVEVREQLAHVLHGLGRRAGIRSGDDRIGPPLERLPILGGDAEHVGDDEHRQWDGDRLDEIVRLAGLGWRRGFPGRSRECAPRDRPPSPA